VLSEFLHQPARSTIAAAMSTMYVQRIATLGYGYVSPIVDKVRSRVPLVDSAAKTAEEYVPAALRSTDNYISMACRFVQVRVTSVKAKAQDTKEQGAAVVSKTVDKATLVKSQLQEKVSAVILPVRLRAASAKDALLERLSSVKLVLVESKDKLFGSLRATLSKIATKLNIDKLSARVMEQTTAAKQRAGALATQTGAGIHSVLVRVFGGERVDIVLAKVAKYASSTSRKVTAEKKES